MATSGSPVAVTPARNGPAAIGPPGTMVSDDVRLGTARELSRERRREARSIVRRAPRAVRAAASAHYRLGCSARWIRGSSAFAVDMLLAVVGQGHLAIGTVRCCLFDRAGLARNGGRPRLPFAIPFSACGLSLA